MRLQELLAGGDVGSTDLGAYDPDITAVDYDSRRVRTGSLFCCLRGSDADGHDFAASALDAGAAALVVDHRLPLDVAQIVVDDTRAAMGRLASAHQGHPSRRLVVVGVTGTNGKTTTTHMIGSICRAAGTSCEVLGTLSGPRTTPEAPELQATLAAAVAAGTEVVAMEVSSHALVQHRVTGTRFAVAGFTNLSPDHLDYHADLDDYFAAKARLFEPGVSERGVVDVDTPWGRRLADEAQIAITEVDLTQAQDLEMSPSGSRFAWRGHSVEVSTPGRFNVANALLAAEICGAIGMSDETVAAGLGHLDQVPGRFQLVDVGQPYRIVVDYAHTPDGLAKLLESVGEVTRGRIIVVFGCGGDRDRSKRPLMGAVAERLADRVVVTSDNPRSEDPDDIIAAIVEGMERAPDVVEPDRGRAIELALRSAGHDDVVVIAGKGHETTQTIGDDVADFDDALVAAACARSLLGEAGS